MLPHTTPSNNEAGGFPHLGYLIGGPDYAGILLLGALYFRKPPGF